MTQSPSDPILLSTSLHVDEARKAIASLVNVLIHESQYINTTHDKECIALDQAIDRILAEDLLSPIDVPAADNSAMDGYAFHGVCLDESGQTVVLQIIGTAYAGKPYDGKVEPGQCLKIMTGALMPQGLDTVVPQEFTTELSLNDKLAIEFNRTLLKRGENRRLRGEDLQKGKAAISAGRILRPSDLGLAASLGIAELKVRRRLKVAILSSGDELCPLGQKLEAGSIYDSNRYSLIGLLNRLNLEIIDCGIVRDDPSALKQAFFEAAKVADVLICSGGVSVGEAVLVTFYQFVRSALLQLNGASQTSPPITQAIAQDPIRKRAGRTEFQRAILGRREDGKPTVRTTGSQGAGILRSMSEANCFIILNHEQGNVAAGEWVDVALFEGLL